MIEVCLVTTLVASCKDSFMESSLSDETTSSLELAATADAAGNYTAALDPNATSTQVLRAGGSITGSAIAMPPGALSLAVSITIGEGESLASSNTVQQLGLSGNSASAAGPAVSFVPSSSIEASNPFTLSLPMTGTTLALADGSDENLVVMYKAMKVENDVVSYSVGIMTRDELTVGAKTVQFQTKNFGTFQLAKTDTKITTRVSKATDEPPVLKGDASNPLVGVWKGCSEKTYSNSSGSSSSQETTTPWTPPVIGITCGPYATKFKLQMKVAGASQYSAKIYVDDVLKETAILSGAVNTYVTTTGFSESVTASQVVKVDVGPECYIGTATSPKQYASYHSNACDNLSSPLEVYCDGSTAYDSTTTTTTTTSSSSSTTGSYALGTKSGQTAHEQEFVKFSNNTFIHATSVFSGAQCTGTLISRKEETGSYTLGNLNGDGTQAIDIKMATEKGTIFTADGVAAANTSSTGCWNSGWVIGVTKDLFTTECKNSSTSTDDGEGPGVVKIEGSRIYFEDKKESGVLDRTKYLTKE